MLDERCINTIRGLAMDGVERAQSGHPGLPLGAATLAYALWTRHLRYDPRDPDWPDRDRFILSAGHGSMLLYAMLHLTGYDLPLDELKRFRQWGSRTPGHPEHGMTPGVETTTGPLGQGFANGVGMAMAERWLAEHFNRPGHEIVDHRTYVLASDGDLMEGISSEAASLAGHLGLGRLTVLYDSNGITIDGSTALAFGENVAERFEAYGWQVQHVDGHDLAAVDAALAAAREDAERPSLVVARTHIGFGSPHKQDSAASHGAPLGAEEVRLTKERLGLPPDQEFHVPNDVAAHMRSALERGAAARAEWQERLEAYSMAWPDRAAAFQSACRGEPPAGWDDALPEFAPGKALATRAASGAVLNALAPQVPALLGGSADLAASNNTDIEGSESMARGAYGGRNLHFGVREHGMGGILNGLALHGLRPYGATFLIFSDYMRPAIRLAALMGLPVIYLFTHDSIGLGEDGPTHQPVEQLMSLRLIPNLHVVRPADAAETAEAWKLALARRDGPTALALTRQKLPVLERGPSGLAPAAGLARGGYILAEAERDGEPVTPDVVLIATGSEVHPCLEARRLLAVEGTHARVVSMPCPTLFDGQPEEYREQVLSTVAARLAVEAGASLGWERYVGPNGAVAGIDRFGASAPGDRLMHEFGFTAQDIAARAERLARTGGERRLLTR